MFGLSNFAYAAAIKSITAKAVKDGIRSVSVRLTSATRGIVIAQDGTAHGYTV